VQSAEVAGVRERGRPEGQREHHQRAPTRRPGVERVRGPCVEHDGERDEHRPTHDERRPGRGHLIQPLYRPGVDQRHHREPGRGEHAEECTEEHPTGGRVDGGRPDQQPETEQREQHPEQLVDARAAPTHQQHQHGSAADGDQRGEADPGQRDRGEVADLEQRGEQAGGPDPAPGGPAARHAAAGGGNVDDEENTAEAEPDGGHSERGPTGQLGEQPPEQAAGAPQHPGGDEQGHAPTGRPPTGERHDRTAPTKTRRMGIATRSCARDGKSTPKPQLRPGGRRTAPLDAGRWGDREQAMHGLERAYPPDAGQGDFVDCSVLGKGLRRSPLP
jgi:hypothetical protein